MPKSTTAKGDDQTLSSKHAGLFRQIVRCYETKQFKKGIKVADTILKDNPRHGETTSMKGLLYNCLERREEAKELIKLGLRYNLKSHVCWHVYGLLYRSERNYVDAIKCYTNALKIDAGNMQILKDMASLQTQVRDFAGLVATRRQLLTLKPSLRTNWFGFIAAQHLHGDLNKALEVFDSYVESVELRDDIETSEMFLYRDMILDEAGLTEKALDSLMEYKEMIKDKTRWTEKTAKYNAQLGYKQEAEQLYMQLLCFNSENTDYYMALAELHDHTSPSETIDMLQHLQVDFPSSLALQRLPLALCEASSFQALVEPYLNDRLQRGIPSLFRDLKPLYANAEKSRILCDLVTSLVSTVPKDGTESKLRFWTLFYAAQHYDLLGEYERALSCINDAVEERPTELDSYLVKAKVLKHCGDHQAAFEAVDAARQMDLADRYINTKAVKYAFRAGLLEKADELALLFLRDEDNTTYMFEMQATWYEVASGEAFRAAKENGMALKKLTAVEKHYYDMTEEQFDFHGYCLRKMTLCSYIDSLRWTQSHRNVPIYRRAIKNVVEIYLELEEKRQIEKKERQEREVTMSQEEIKRFNAKEKRRARKSTRRSVESKHDAPFRSPEGKEYENEDPFGDELADAEPLPAAEKYVKLLQTYCPDWFETHILAERVFRCQKKLLLAGKEIQKASAFLDGNEEGTGPDEKALFHVAVVFLAHYLETSTDCHEAIKAATQKIVNAVLSEMPLSKLNQTFADKANSVVEWTAVLECAALLDVSTLAGFASHFVRLLTKGSLSNCLAWTADAYACLKKLTCDAEAEQLRAFGEQEFPRATVFRRHS